MARPLVLEASLASGDYQAQDKSRKGPKSEQQLQMAIGNRSQKRGPSLTQASTVSAQQC